MAELIRHESRELTAPDGTKHRVLVPVYGDPTFDDVRQTIRNMDKRRAALGIIRRRLQTQRDDRAAYVPGARGSYRDPE